MTGTHHIRQRTIKQESSCTGVGLHTGVESTITFKPAPKDHGIRFKRTDIKGSPAIRADIDHVVIYPEEQQLSKMEFGYIL